MTNPTDVVQVITTMHHEEVSEMLYDAKVTPVDAPAVQDASGYTVFAVTAEDYCDLVSIPDDMVINVSTIDQV